ALPISFLGAKHPLRTERVRRAADERVTNDLVWRKVLEVEHRDARQLGAEGREHLLPDAHGFRVLWFERAAGRLGRRRERDLLGLLLRGLPAVLEPADERLVQDRKSTRLNSSHVKISYAVFCLKQ